MEFFQNFSFEGTRFAYPVTLDLEPISSDRRSAPIPGFEIGSA
jgi:hypothetical protein